MAAAPVPTHATAPSTLSICLLGSFRLSYAGQAVPGFDQARLQQLLSYLLLHRKVPVPRQQLAYLFWPDSTDEQARTNLRNLWHRLRRTLPEADRFLEADEMAIQWRDAAPWWLDVAGFEACLSDAGAAVERVVQVHHLEQAIALYGGELLPGCYSEWLLAERDRLAAAYSRALEQLSTLYEEARQYEKAIGHAQALLRHDPLHEPAYAQLMRLHALNNERAAALHTYHTCATVLRRELDAEPDRSTRELYEQLMGRAQPLALTRPEKPAPLVGRDTEWVLLQRAWRESAVRSRALLISGDAGIGKTRLGEELVEWADRQGIPALSARCYPSEGQLAYAPLVTLLRARPLPQLADPWLRELARLLPEVLVDRPNLPPPEPLSQEWQRLRLFEALAHALLSGRSALLLFLDDLDMCDRDTLDWLHFLLTTRRNADRRAHLLLVATAGSDEGTAPAALPAWTAGLAHAGLLTKIELGPLSPDATLALASRVAGRPFDPALKPLLYEGTEGNPLFVVEMLSVEPARSGEITAEHAAAMLVPPRPLPAKVRMVIEARLAQLSPPARGVVDLASVIGRTFTYAVLARATDLGEGALVDSIDECWRRRIIRELGDDAYDFGHAKLREVAYAALSRTRRHWLHGQVARALESLHAGDLDRAAGVIAAHYEAAGLPAQAIGYYGRAAKMARRVYAQHEALAALEKAIGLADALSDDAARCSLATPYHEELGDLRELLARHASARDAYAAALACAPDDDTITRARLLRKVGKTLGSERAAHARVVAQYDAAEALLGTPGEALGPDWWMEWCQVHLDYLGQLYWWGRTEEMAERLARVRSLIEQHGTPVQCAELFANLNRQLNRSSRYAPSPAALGYAHAAIDALPPSASPELRAPYQFVLGFNLLWHGTPADAEAALQTALHMAELSGDVVLQARCLAYLAVAHRRMGRGADVEALSRRTLAVAEAAAMPDYVGVGRAGLAWTAWRRGDLNEAGQMAASALEAWRTAPAPYPLQWQALWPLIVVALARDCLSDAVEHARRLAEPGQQALPAPLEEAIAAGLAAWDSGRAAAARDALEQALDLALELSLF
ncbi:MAG TPA: BTAD domain-containing putative transcriptional regulator [Anaerolineae bacterium]|nr:BTAD domain-containing putative transcriptional regulator [Anaerolineae bacterium]